MPDPRRGGALRLGVVALWVTIVAVASAQDQAASDTQTIDQLQGSLLVTFARFVEWPPVSFPSAVAPIVIGIAADEGVTEALDRSSRGKTVAGRAIVIKRLQWDSDFAGVHMVFLGETGKRHMGLILDRVRRQPVVTVSSLTGFGSAGGMITLKVASGRVSFSVNSAATALSGVKLSSFLLSHATKVSQESGLPVR
jgi:hypothetical protein